ncbi:MAG: glycosyltransferase family 4 protein [Acidobacteriota bacterium]|nr:glycosyltransferase family 4 protein [Acidobacteriota bacterium]
METRTVTLGWLSPEKTASALAAGDLLLMPSLYEPFGLLAVEAMALGLPVVALNAWGPRDIVVHEKTGLPAEATSASLAAQLHRIITDRSFRKSGGADAAARVRQHFTLPGLTARLDALYRKILAGRSGR